jgi:hypothetical protein
MLELQLFHIPYFLEYPTHFYGKNADQNLGCTAYSHTNIVDIAVFRYIMICLLS